MDTKTFRAECLQAHNKCRRAHGANDLQLDDGLNAEAQRWADHLARRNRGLEHSDTKHGENVAFTSGDASGFSITEMWYSEVKDYSWTAHGSKNGRPVGHFTQVVWKDTKQAGFGIAKNGRNVFAVGNYKPAGNMMMAGYYKANVGEKEHEPEFPKAENPSTGSGHDSGEMPKPGTSVNTKIEIVEKNGVRMKKTTTITTTITEDGIKRTSTQTQFEQLRSDEEISEKMEELEASDDDAIDEDSSDDERENDMSRPDKKIFRRDCKRHINRLRRDHGMARFRRSRILQKAAQQHANRMLRSGNWSFIEDVQYGQAIVEKRPRPTGEQIASHFFEVGRDSGQTNGFVREGSGLIGIGIASNKDGRSFVAALFDPRRGAVNQFLASVVEE